jgi:hypothetical protein
VIERSKIPTVVLKSDPAVIRNAISKRAVGTRIVVV